MTVTPESNPGALVVSSPKALAIANRQLRIAGQALARIGQERYIDFFATHPQASRAFVIAVARYYPCTESLIDRFEELRDWRLLSGNEAIPWSEALIERYAEQLGWRWIGYNRALPWSDELIARYASILDWESLSYNRSLPWSEALIERYAKRWHWKGVSSNNALPWSEEIITRYASLLDWTYLSANRALPWSARLIAEYAGRWDWRSLSGNEALPWSEKLIEHYAARWDWTRLSNNQGLPWSQSLRNRYKGRWSPSIIGTEALPWRTPLAPMIEDCAKRFGWKWLSSNNTLPWTRELIEHFAQRWDWDMLSYNRSLSWTESLIADYATRWQWGQPGARDRVVFRRYFSGDGSGLSGNEALPWSEELIERYADLWVWAYLPQVALSKILPRWSEASIVAVMARLSPRTSVVSKPEPAIMARPSGSEFDSEFFEAGAELAVFHLEAGARAFADYSRAMVEDLGAKVRPYLRGLYEGARHWPGFDTTGMTPIIEMDAEVAAMERGNQETAAQAQIAPHGGNLYGDLPEGTAQDPASPRQICDSIQGRRNPNLVQGHETE